MSNELASVSRRDFVAGGAGVVSASVLGGLGASLTEARADGAPIELRGNLTMADIEQSAVELDPISDFAVEETYDIVVVGAGDSGVCAVLTAVEEGATVACLQKEEAVAANGTGASAVIKGESTPAGIKRWMADWSQVNGWRTNNALFQHYVDHSEETLSWVIQRGIEAGVEPVNYEGPDSVKYDDGNVCAVIKVRQPSNLELMTALAAKATDEGAVFYYATPAVQLVQDADGTVTGVIGKQKDGTYVKLNATKGVVLAAGDYMNNASLVDRYAADTKPFWRKQANRTGDGHILGILAGGTMAPAHHARQIHGIIGPFMKTPLLMLDLAGNRFMNETAIMTDWGVQMALSGSYATPYPTLEQDYIHRFFDAALNEKYTGVPTLESIDKQIDEGTTMYYFRGDTIEDLAAQLEAAGRGRPGQHRPLQRAGRGGQRRGLRRARQPDGHYRHPAVLLHPRPPRPGGHQRRRAGRRQLPDRRRAGRAHPAPVWRRRERGQRVRRHQLEHGRRSLRQPLLHGRSLHGHPRAHRRRRTFQPLCLCRRRREVRRRERQLPLASRECQERHQPVVTQPFDAPGGVSP